MDHSPQGHGTGEHTEVHLPDPSIWPLIVGAAFALVGAALIYYSRDRQSDFAGPFLGAAAVIALIAGCGWAYEDGRMKKKAEEGSHAPKGTPRFTQVVTFAIPEGQYLASRAEGGIISMLEGTDNRLRDLDGFQDLRVIVSPAETGPSQVLVETTWADREGLATYEETRQTMLDLLSQNGEQVSTGSVQVFDMEVVRDTKDTSFNFGTGAVVTTFAALMAGGLMVGAGLNLFAEDNKGGGGGGGAPTAAAPSNIIAAKNTKFTSGTSLEAPPNTAITLVFDNQEAVPHNVQIFAGASAGGPLLKGCTAGCSGDEVSLPLKGGPDKITFTFTTPGEGTYAFDCAAHPDQMKGTLTVKAGAAAPGQAAPAAGASPSAAAK
jgi:plastocyanin